MNKKERILSIIRKIIDVFVIVLLISATVFLFSGHAKNIQRIIFMIGQFVMMLLVLNLPKILKSKYDIQIPFMLDIYFVLFAFCGFILGDVFNFYGRYPYWDAVLHAFSGVILAYAGFLIIDFLDKEYTIPLSFNPKFICVAVVLFSLSLGAVWEIAEFLIDDMFKTNSQQYMKSTDGTLIGETDIPLEGHEALRDTMNDLMLDFGGAIVVATITYKNIESKRKKALQKM
ncbi:MAG: hypothetical protein RR512_05895 [Coprobacillus sp.]